MNYPRNKKIHGISTLYLTKSNSFVHKTVVNNIEAYTYIFINFLEKKIHKSILRFLPWSLGFHNLKIPTALTD